MKRTKTQQTGIGRPVAREIVAPSPARSGMVLLFVVVLLTLLAVMGGAYLVSSRIDNSQVSPTDRGGEANPMGLDAADRIDQIMLKAQDATKRKLFLDAFAYNGIVPANAGTYPTAQRVLGDESGDDGTGNTSIRSGTGDTVPDLVWRPTEANRQAVMPLPAAAPTADELGVFTPMAAFGPFAATRGIFDYAAVPPATPYANTVHFPYYHVDALGGTDTHLASRLPIFDNFRSPALNEFIWPWVSGPIVGVPDFPVDNVFADPLQNAFLSFDLLATASAGFDANLQRANLIPGTAGPVAYPPPPEVTSLSGTGPEFYNDRLRTWPALVGSFDLGQDGPTADDVTIFLAGDADGDGVADAGLVPIVFNENAFIGTLDRYVDPQTGYVYLVGIRIVDNNDAINVNTALTRYADLRLPWADGLNPPTRAPLNLGGDGVDDPDTNDDVLLDPTLQTAEIVNVTLDTPNRGIFLSNVGLLELFFQGVDNDPPFGPAGDDFDDMGGGRTRHSQFQLLLSTMLGSPLDLHVGNNVATFRTDIQHATLGEVLAMNRDRLLDYADQSVAFPHSVGQTLLGTTTGNVAIRPFRSMDEDGMLGFNGGGWLEPEVAPTRLENAAFDALRVSAGNYVPNAKMMFDIFPLGVDIGTGAPPTPGGDEPQGVLRALWAAHFKNADPDMTTFLGFQNSYAPNLPNLGLRFDGRDWPLSPRAALVAHNGTSQAFRPHTLLPTTDLTTPGLVVQWEVAPNVFTGMPPYHNDGTGIVPRPPVRASANTAGFAELWRAFWNVMLEPDFSPAAAGYLGPVPSYVPGQRLPAGDPQNTTERMFRNDYYSGFVANRWFSQTTPLEPPDHYQILTLRAALAAINALDIRDVEDVRHSDPGVDGVWGTPIGAPDDVHPIPTAADIVLDPTPGSVTGERYLARVAGSEAQPFITEAYVVFDAGGVVQYIAVELHNPYPFELHLQNWYLLGIHGAHRPERWNVSTLNTAAIISMTGADFSTPINVTIPANSYVVLQNEPPPATIILDPTAVTDGRVYTGQALTPGGPSGLLVPSGSGRIQDGAQIIRELLLMRPLDPFSANLGQIATTADQIIAECVPADFFDPSGADPFQVAAPPGTDPAIWRYVRPNDERSWKFVAHGEWRLPAPGEAGTADFAPVDALIMATATLGARDLDTATPPARSIPWGPVLSGPVTVDDDSGTSTPKALYPYGGFARDGDALGIPFLGSYRLYRDVNGDGLVDPLTDHLLELVPPTLDAFFAERLPAGVPPTPTPTTHIGRFIPQGQAFQPTGTPPDELDEGYNWATDFFEYITTLHAPGKDYAPHADTRYMDNSAANPDNALVFNPGSIPVQDQTLNPYTLFGLAPETIANDGAPGNDYLEAFLPVEGQLNLNTASFGILKTLPLAVGPTGNVDATAIPRISGAATTEGDPSTGLAGSVFLGRQATPYNSAFRLNSLPENFAAGTGEFRDFGAAAGVSRRAAGDISGFNPLSEDVNRNGILDPGEDLNGNLTLDAVPSFADLMVETEDLNGNGILDPGEDRNGNAVLDVASRYYDAGPRDPAALPPDPADYEDDTLQLTRISNLTTLRSDSYTVYIVVQAWENFGNPPQTTSTDPPPARMIRQERSAFIVDRSGILPFNPNSTPPPGAPPLPWTPADINGDAWRDVLKITPIPTR